MKKVLFVATVDIHIRKFHLPYLKLFHDNGYEVHVATNGDDSFPNCDVKHKICVERNPFKFNNFKAIKQLKKIIEKEQYDIIHCHTPMGSVVTRLAAIKARKKFNTRVIYTAHGLHFFKGAPLKNWLIFYPVEKFLSRFTDTLILINQEDYDLCKRKFKKCRDIQYVPGVGIDINKFNINFSIKQKEKLKKDLGLKKTDFVLTCVARLDNNKNQIFLIKVMEKLLMKVDTVHLLLVGPDELSGFYNKIVDEKKLSSNIHFLGMREDIPEILSITDVVVSASLREGLPVNIIEAFAANKPVVTLNCRGMNDLIVNEKNGFIISNCNEMIEKILLLMENKTIIQTIITNNKNKSINYDVNTIIDDMKKIYFRKKKVIHFLASNKFSGAENVVCTIINNTKEDYSMYYCSPKGSIENNLKEMNINYLPLEKLSVKEIKNIIKKIQPDVIHAHDNKATVLCSLFGNKYKVISHIHGNNKIMNTINLKTILFNFCSKKLFKIIWVSDSSFDGYYFKKNVKDKSIILYNVVDQKAIEEKSKQYRCDEVFDLIFLGRLGYPKNPERLIDIIELVKQKKNDIRVAIVGDGPDKNLVEEKIKEKNLNKNIKLFGFQSNPYPILRNSKILIMTSIYEGTPMCALEAQALGKFIVATPVDGLKKIVVNNVNGYLSDNNEELSNKILEFLYKKNFVVQNYDNDLNSYINKIDKIYGVIK